MSFGSDSKKREKRAQKADAKGAFDTQVTPTGQIGPIAPSNVLRTGARPSCRGSRGWTVLTARHGIHNVDFVARCNVRTACWPRETNSPFTATANGGRAPNATVHR